MRDTTAFYNQQLAKHKQDAANFFKTLTTLSLLRLAVFLLTGVGVYFTYSNWQIAVVIGVVGVILFLLLLSKYTALKAKRTLSKELVAINEEELQIASGHFYDRNEGTAYQDASHFYSLDIDLFGRGSFFQFINRTALNEGTDKLAQHLVANDISEIKSRQDAIKELATKPEWRQFYTAIARVIKTETSADKSISWLQKHHAFLPKAFQWIPLLFTVLSILLFSLSFFKLLDVSFIGYWLLFGLLLTGKYLKKINDLASNTSKIKETFQQYSQLLNEIETANFNSELLQKKQKLITSEHKKASLIISDFAKAIDALDNRNNLIAAIFGNGFFLTDLKNTFAIERWIEKHKEKVADWFDVVTFFDAYNSLGNYAYNHSEFVFPELVEDKTVIKATQLGHPLLDKTKRIASNVTINNQEFFIVTGANMAGKSTFLRTISLHIVMANSGLPVCAESSQYHPVKLITSMRTNDSLTDDSSYFFSELTRLKYIVDAIAKEPYFIILDEILKGTNSTDKAIGSRKFVEKLVAGSATGIIATHDLSLCEIADDLQQVKNYFFDAQIVNDELYFDYTFKKGICQNMNASFLLKKMEII